MNRFIMIGLTTPPCGVPRSRGNRSPSVVSNGAVSHRSIYSSIQPSLMWLLTCLHQEAMIDLIESRLDVKLHHPVELPTPLSGDSYRLFADRPGQSPTTYGSTACTDSVTGSGRTSRWFPHRCPQPHNWP